MASVALLLALAGAALALVYGAALVIADASLTRSLVKTLSVVCLALAGQVGGAPGLMTAGLALGALGDWFLSRPGQAAFLAGMGAFGLGHLAYAALFLSAGAGWPGFAACGLLALLALSTEVWLQPGAGRLGWPVRAYVAIITLMGLTALGLPDAWLLKLGVLLFVLSDMLLAAGLFALPSAPRPTLGRAVWAAYWGGQALILLGSLGLPA